MRLKSALLATLLASLLAQACTAANMLTCAAAGSPLAEATSPVLTTSCPSSCSIYTFCIYYPRALQGSCVPTAQRACLIGDACAFQCVPNPASSVALSVTIYDRDAGLDSADEWNSKVMYTDPLRQSININASQVARWVDDVEIPSRNTIFYITGNEAANNYPLTSEKRAQGAQTLPRGDVVRFEMPSTLLRALQHHTHVRIENVKFPTMPAKDTTSLVFAQLQQLYLRNSLLTLFPLANASFSVLNTLDLSVNSIMELPQKSLSSSLDYLNVSWNELVTVTNQSLASSLTILDLSRNKIRTISKGTFPSRIQTLMLGSNLLTEIPGDVAELKSLKTLSLDNNALRDIPEGALPPRGIPALSLANCSLSSIPKVLQSMTALSELSLARNDLSQDSNLAGLPKTLKQLDLENCRLQQVPAGLKDLSSLTQLSLGMNPQAIPNLDDLPKSLRTLLMHDNGLDEVPSAVTNLSIETLVLDGNPLGRLAPGSLPSTLRTLSISNASLETVSTNTLPTGLEELRISTSALVEVPPDIRTMRGLTSLEIPRSKLQGFDIGDVMESIRYIDLQQNQITRFDGRAPKLVYLDLRQNVISDFSLSDASLLETLELGDNNLASIPESVFQMKQLSLLNLTRNPIRNFAPTGAQVDALVRIETVVLAQEMFASDCEASKHVDVHGYSACPPPTLSKKSWLWLVPVNIGVAVLLALLVGTFWHRRQLQKRRLLDLEAQQASLEKQQRNQNAAQIWTDTVLLQNRLDEDRVERLRLLGSGTHAEVWLVAYKNQQFALKQLMQLGGRDGDIDRERINAFVEEIKLLSSLTHASIVQFVGVLWTKESDLALVTEYMAGGDLRSYLDQHPKIYAGWTTQMVRIALQVTEAIVYLHSLDPIVIHRDLKSRNVLLDQSMRAKLNDFGLSRVQEDDITMTTGVGTVRWTAPEVLAGEEYDEAADIYSLGIIMSEIDTHKLPFEDTVHHSDAEIANLVMTGSLTVGLSKSCPSEIRSLVERCTVFDPLDRPNGLQVAYELRMLLKNTRSLEKNITAVGRPPKAR